MEGSEEFTGLVYALASFKLWEAILVFIISFIIFNIIKNIASTIFQIIMFKTDVIGIGSKVEYKGKRGIIKDIGIRRILIELESENSTLFVRTMEWKYLILLIPDNIQNKKKE